MRLSGPYQTQHLYAAMLSGLLNAERPNELSQALREGIQLLEPIVLRYEQLCASPTPSPRPRTGWPGRPKLELVRTGREPE